MSDLRRCPTNVEHNKLTVHLSLWTLHLLGVFVFASSPPEFNYPQGGDTAMVASPQVDMTRALPLT